MVSTVASQQEGPGFDAQSRVFGYPGFLPGVNGSVNWISWHPVLSARRHPPEVGWDWLKLSLRPKNR